MSRFFPRGSKNPDVEVAPGERALTVGRTPSGAAVAVTAQALYLPTRTGEVRRVPWDDVTHATWEPPVLEVHTGGPPLRVLLDEPGRVPEAVRERVTASIVVSERVELVGVGSLDGAGAQITGRRSAEGTQLRWTITFDHGLDPADPELRAAADRELARIKDWYGP